MPKKIRTRFAPSPTGYLHIGGVRSALYPELLARQLGGDFILRIEDTDQARFMPGATENLCRTLKMLGIEPNEGVWIDDSGKIIERGPRGPYIQSLRKSAHQAYAKQLMDMDKAYYCFCTEERLTEMRINQELAHLPTGYDGLCRKLSKEEAQKKVDAGEGHVIRLKLPKEGSVVVDDIIRGKVKFEWKLVDDQVIIKRDGMATYHLASMADDHDMGITHVIRGEEWLSSAPKHVFIYQAFGWELPVFAHLPLILNADRSKLSKRQGDVSTESYLDKGYLPEALINFVALMGWNPKGDQEIYSHKELVDLFDLSKVNKAGAIFNIEKLNWLNNHYLRQLPDDKYFSLILQYLPKTESDLELKRRVALLFRERLNLPAEITELSAFIFKPKLDYSGISLTWKDHTKEEASERLKTAKEWIEQLDDSMMLDSKAIEQVIKSKIIDKGWGNGDTLWPLRVALSAQEKSPSPFELIAIYGKTRALKRVGETLEYLK
ncbi:MAG: glutamate--tRNA ligase [Patescibacteria group bacterium]|jgi:glutamyl-tRNA synthetase